MNKEELKKHIIKQASTRPPRQQEEKMPSVIDMAKNLATTAVETIKTVAVGNSANLTQEEAQKRKNICNTCPSFNKSQERCTKCGCYMAIKTYLRAATCPLGKW